MNKYKKIATAVVSIVLAGTMVGSLAACKTNVDDEGGRPTELNPTRFNSENLETKELGGLKFTVDKETGKLAYSVGTQIVSNIIDSGNTDRHITYDTAQIAGSWDGLDGYTYYAGDLKPAWWQFGQTLGIDFVDNAKSGRNGKELTEVSNGNEWADYNLINSGVSQISANATNLVDLSQFLEYMPNFQNFLDEYEIVKWSLKMDESGAMYYIPYFDGNDDIEKYEMVQRDWVKVVLDGTLPSADKAITYAEHYEAKFPDGDIEKDLLNANGLASSFMGTTGEDDWTVKTTDPSDVTKTVDLVVSYKAVIDALKDSDSDLYKAIVAISGVSAPQTESGNIVDIQNDIIKKTKGEVNGAELASVLREYIKVAYKLDGKAYSTLSDIFVSASAGWDADLMTAMFRCVVTNYKSFNGLGNALASEIYALAGREMKAQRQNDLIALAGELYGVRGMESRLEYLYIDSNGDLQDARLEEESYEAALKLNSLANEGLLYTAVGKTSSTINKLYKAGANVAFMLHDYAQTQTKDGFTSDSFDFAPIVTPVSRWDTNDDGTAETVMRFTESWRSVKNSGVCIPTASVANKPETLSAILSFVDYLFSNDGQIVGSYGPMSTVGNTAEADGFWYGNNGVSVLNDDGTVKSEYADKVASVDGVQYFLKKAYRGEGFMYDNVLYKGLDYNGKQIPIMTDNNSDFYLGGEVNGNKMDTDNEVGYKKNHTGNYTDYARGVVGAALPIGNKDQGFEYQCTAKVGLEGASIVNDAIQNGTIKHLTQTIDKDNWWYTVSPTLLPVNSTQATDINNQKFLDGSGSEVGFFNPTSTAGLTNVYIDLAFWGLSNDYYIGTGHADDGDYQMATSISDLMTLIKSEGKGNGLEARYGWYSEAWATLKNINK